MKIVLYGKQGHAYTVAFKNFLNSTDEAYIYKDVSKAAEAREHSKESYDGVVSGQAPMHNCVHVLITDTEYRL